MVYRQEKIKNVEKIAEMRLCIGCGVCVYACPEGKVRLVDVIDDGIRPIIESGGCGSCDDCLKVCPGYETVHMQSIEYSRTIQVLKKRCGPVLEVWEGYAANPEIRYKGSSGGLSTALSLFCIEKMGMEGTLHIGADKAIPWKNATYMSTKKAELISRTGSRYSPASPCEGLKQIENAVSTCVFIGKPCDVTGLRKAQSLNPKLKEKTGLAIGFFCAGTPATRGTLDFFEKFNVKPEEIADFKYRGNGWPGMAAMRLKGEENPSIKVSYKESWGFLQKYRPFRCYMCPDLTAEFADISVGDPWYREICENEPGRSLILVRTEKGRWLFKQALKEQYVIAEQVGPDIIYNSQVNLFTKRQAIWGRLIALKIFGLPVPRLVGFSLFENWLDQNFKEKLRSLLGTARRIINAKYSKPLNYKALPRS